MKSNLSFRKAAEKDFDLVYKIKKNELEDYITQTWGWDEVLRKIRFYCLQRRKPAL